MLDELIGVRKRNSLRSKAVSRGNRILCTAKLFPLNVSPGMGTWLRQPPVPVVEFYQLGYLVATTALASKSKHQPVRTLGLGNFTNPL